MSAPFATPLPEPHDGSTVVARSARGADLAELRALVLSVAQETGFGSRAEDFVLAVSEVAANTVRHADGRIELRLWQDDRSLICDVRGSGRIEDPLAGRIKPPRDAMGGRGLWIANQLCDLVQIRVADGGSTMRLHLNRD